MSNIRSEIILTGETLPEGTSTRIVCPACGGGTSEEKSLSVTHVDGAILWQCFRANCGEAGGSGNTTPSVSAEVKPIVRWEGKTHPVPEQVALRIEHLWGLRDVDDWYWTTDMGGRVAMSVRDPMNKHRGWVLRAISSGARTKALTYIETGESLSWYRTNPFAPTVVVEDIPSAIRASKYVNAVALLGTALSLEKAIEIATHAPKPVLIALDQDAVAQSFKLQKKYGLLWDSPEILSLQMDIKNMTDNELKEKLQWKQST